MTKAIEKRNRMQKKIEGIAAQHRAITILCDGFTAMIEQLARLDRKIENEGELELEERQQCLRI